ncbi:hypothetical protein BsWGS_02358 [Bradybaena similaris]
MLYLQANLVLSYSWNDSSEISSQTVNNDTITNFSESRSDIWSSNNGSYFGSRTNNFEYFLQVITKRINTLYGKDKVKSRIALSRIESIINRRQHSQEIYHENPEVWGGRNVVSVDDNNQEEIEEIRRNEMYLEENIRRSAGMPHNETKRGLKARRFLSNVQKSLKKHVEQGGATWKTSKKEIKKTFEAYYECLRKKVETIRKEEFPIKAFLAIEGESVQMTCEACYRPDESEESQKAIWQLLRHETSLLEQVYEDDRISISKDYTLLLEKIDVNDAGQYFCLERRDYVAVYQLDVFLTDKRKKLRLGEELPAPETFLMQQNLRVFTMWASWGECNTCDKLGERPRIGQCTVKKIYQDIPVFPRDYPLMVLYPEGVPCHSTALPRHIRSMAAISNRESETALVQCNEPCPTDPPVSTITDESGNVVEVVEAGFHSMKEKPLLPSLVKRKVMYEPEKSHLVLNCPTKANPNLIHWARGEREVDPVDIKKLTKGRVWVDSLTRLHLSPLLLTDTDVYNCWKKQERVASIKLIVIDSINEKIKHYISYAGLVVTVVGSLICLFCICCKKSDKNAK